MARALRKVFGLRTAVVTSLVDNEVGHLVEDLMMAGGWTCGTSVGCATTGSERPLGSVSTSRRRLRNPPSPRGE